MIRMANPLKTFYSSSEQKLSEEDLPCQIVAKDNLNFHM